MWPHLFETIREATEGEKATCTIQSFVGVIVGAPCHTACRSLLPQVLMRLRLPPPSPPFFRPPELNLAAWPAIALNARLASAGLPWAVRQDGVWSIVRGFEGSMGKLTGITVLDLTQFLPGPMMTVMMADQGAEVIKIEPPHGDPAREQEPFDTYGDEEQSVWFANLNRGKRSYALDLKSDTGKAKLTELVAKADVFVEGFRPGVMTRLGFDYDSVKAIKSDIVYCSISAFGQSGELSHHPAHDLAVQAMAGFLSVNDGADGAPVVPGVASSDMAAGLTALSSVLMALLGRERTGEGAYIDCAMFDSLLPWCTHTASGAIAGLEAPQSAKQRSLGGAAFYQVYETADGKHVVLGGRETKFAQNLLTALNREDEDQSLSCFFLLETIHHDTVQ